MKYKIKEMAHWANKIEYIIVLACTNEISLDKKKEIAFHSIQVSCNAMIT